MRSIINYILKLFIILSFILLISLMLAVIFAYLTGINIDIDKDESNNIEIVMYKKENKTNTEGTIQNISIDSYVNNGLSIEDENIESYKYTEDNYFYNQLDEYGKIIYDSIYLNSENLKTGRYNINLNNRIKINSEEDEEKLKSSYKNAVDCIRYDNMNLFYIDFTKLFLKIEKTTKGREVSYNINISKGNEYLNYYIDGINDQQQLESILNYIQSEKDRIISQIDGTSYQKILAVHDYLVDNLKYDETYEELNNDNLIGAFMDKNVICEGYSKAFKYLLDSMEIPCILVIGDATNSLGQSEKHMWNYVQIDDGWYAVDVTWDDPVLIGKATLTEEHRYKYFCRKSDFNKNHFPSGIISVDGKEFVYPELAI